MNAAKGTFAQSYCESNQIAPKAFARHAMCHCLHAPIRWIGKPLVTLRPDSFQADLELVTHCGLLTSGRTLEGELREFNLDYRNQGIWRGLFGQRVSTRRLRRLFRQCMGEQHGSSRASSGDNTPSPL
ncbi:hypothetical protein N9023_04845 [Opitutaceae bacterium]|nr:hypothetical protein [Opitutaceae bacterium]